MSQGIKSLTFTHIQQTAKKRHFDLLLRSTDVRL